MGQWIDVPMESNDVAVFIGRSAEQATAGLLKASRYRLVSPHIRMINKHNSNFLTP